MRTITRSWRAIVRSALPRRVGWRMPVLSLYWRRRQHPFRAVARGVRGPLAVVSSPQALISIQKHLHYTLRSKVVVVPPSSATSPAIRTKREVETVFRRITNRITLWRWTKARPLDAEHTPAPPVASAATAATPSGGASPSTHAATQSSAARTKRIADEMRGQLHRVRIRQRVHREPVTWASPMRSSRAMPYDAAARTFLQTNGRAERRVDRRGTDAVSRSAARRRPDSASPVQSQPRTTSGHRVIAFPSGRRASAGAQPSSRGVRLARAIAWRAPRVRMPATNATNGPSIAFAGGRVAGYATAVPLDWRRPHTAAPDRGRVDPPRVSVPDHVAMTPAHPVAAVTTAPPPATPVGQTAPSAVLPFDRATLDRLAENVISRIERHIRIERERRGL